jgi:hypothetical protein
MVLTVHLRHIPSQRTTTFGSPVDGFPRSVSEYLPVYLRCLTNQSVNIIQLGIVGTNSQRTKADIQLTGESTALPLCQ